MDNSHLIFIGFNMNKLSILLITFFVFSQSIVAASGEIRFDGRVAAFFPTNHIFRQLYGKAIASFEIEAARSFCDDFELWGNINWLCSHGKTLTFHDRTNFQNLNLSFGGKQIFCLDKCTQFYLGLGLNAAYVRVHNHSEFVRNKVYKYGVGGLAKAGFYFEPLDNLYFEAFTDYLYQVIHFEKHTQIGGFKVGGGIGVHF